MVVTIGTTISHLLMNKKPKLQEDWSKKMAELNRDMHDGVMTMRSREQRSLVEVQTDAFV